MSVTTISFETTTLPSATYLTELGDSGPPFTVHGIALGPGDVTKGASGKKKVWPAEELKEAADSLEGTELVIDHNNSADGVVGKVTKAGYKDGSGVVYEAELYDEDLAEKIENDLLEVSIRGYHADVESLEVDDETGALVVEDITFDNLSIVPKGAAPSNTLEMGAHDELSAAELQSFTDGLDSAALAAVEVGAWVEWDDGKGIIVSPIEDGEAEVDIYEESNGKWRSTGETVTADVDDLSPWDVDEEDIGAVEDTEDEESDEEENTSAEENASLIKEGMKFFSTVNDVEVVVTDVSGKVATVQVVDGESSWDEEVSNIIQKLADGDWEHSGHADSDEMLDPPEWEEGDMVQWQVNPEMRGRIVHNPDDENIVMVEVMEDGEPSGYTLTAGYTDIEHVPQENLADTKYSRGDWVEWDTRNSTEMGKVTGSYMEGDDLPDFRGDRGLSPEGDEVLYALRMYKQRDGTWHPIEGKPIGHYEDSLRSAEEPSDTSDEAVELGRSNVEEHDVEEGDWVQWYPSEMSEEHGFVVGVDEPEDDDEEATVTIEVWTQDSDGKWETDGEEVTKPMDEVGYWGNFPRGQEEFADEINPSDPRRAVKPNEDENSESLVSQQVEDALKDKVEKHNEEYGDDDGKRVTYRMLKNVFERGMGAYQDSHREGMTPQQWSYARVNAFLYLVRNGQPENDQYVQDNDLLPEDHPRYNEDAPDGDEEENALTTVDVIVSDVYGQHDPMGSEDEPKTIEEIVERTVTAELESDSDELDEVYARWDDHVNMTASELRRWSKNPCSREASIEPVAVIKRNLRLLERNKDDWTENDISDAKRTISFISRMRGADTADKDGGAHGCPSKRDISLLNWAYNPFDSLPEHPDDDELDEVEEVTLAADEGGTHSGDSSDVASLVEYEMHEVEYSGTHTNDWSRPALEDFVAEMDIDEEIEQFDDLSDEQQEMVADAFIISSSGFPPENYGDLNLPVVEPSGELSLNALAAVKGGRGAGAVDGLSEEMEEEIDAYVNELAAEEFDRDWSEEDEMSEDSYGEDSPEVPDDHRFESKEDAESKAEDMGIEGAHKMGDHWVPGNSHEEYAAAMEEMSASTATDKSVDTDVRVALQTTDTQLTTMTAEEIQEKLSELDEPVAVEQEELSDLQKKADRFDEMSENLEALRERTEVLDEVDQSALEELQETEDAVIVEAQEYEELQHEAEQVKEVYAASLAEEMGAFEAEELAERFDIDELREKFEAEIGSVEEELAASTSDEAEPRSQDPSEEELTDDSDEEELADEVKEKQDEIREKILS